MAIMRTLGIHLHIHSHVRSWQSILYMIDCLHLQAIRFVCFERRFPSTLFPNRERYDYDCARNSI